MIRFAHGAATDVGKVRSLNEDGFLVAESLFAVADGMGGHRGGEVASATALETLRTEVLEPSAPGLVAAVEAANRAVFDQSLGDPALAGMGTTLCAVGLVRDDEGQAAIAVVNVGDSRVYVLDGDDFVQLSEDHSLVELMVRAGQISVDEAAVHPGRNVVTRALGIEPDVDVDCWTVSVKAGDRFLLCSDGLFNELHDDQISAVLRRLASPAEAADELVRLATAAGGRDNVTVVVVDVVDDDGPTDGDSGLIGSRITRLTEPSDDPLGVTAPVSTAPVPVIRPGDDGDTSTTKPRRSRVPKPPEPARAERRGRFTWRVWIFLAGIVAVLGVAFGAIWWAAHHSYYVKLDNGELVIYQGRDGGLLWYDAVVVRRTGVQESQVPGVFLDQVRAGKVEPDRQSAETYVGNIEQDIRQETTTTTTAAPTTTSVQAVTTETAPVAQP